MFYRIDHRFPQLITFTLFFVLLVKLRNFVFTFLFIVFLKKCAIPASFSFIFGLFKQVSLQFLQQIYVKNVHPVYGASIQNHDLRYASLFVNSGNTTNQKISID